LEFDVKRLQGRIGLVGSKIERVDSRVDRVEYTIERVDSRIDRLADRTEGAANSRWDWSDVSWVVSVVFVLMCYACLAYGFDLGYELGKSAVMGDVEVQQTHTEETAAQRVQAVAAAPPLTE
jgi:hypothetical protein